MSRWLEIGGIAPLFDRLTDDNIEELNELVPLINYDEEEYKTSIIRETTILFNTRCTLTYEEYMALEPFSLEFAYPLMYGLPSFIFTDPLSTEGRRFLLKIITTTLRLFEPRILNISISIDKYVTESQTLFIVIQGEIFYRRLLKPIKFPVSVNRYGLAKFQ